MTDHLYRINAGAAVRRSVRAYLQQGAMEGAISYWEDKGWFESTFLIDCRNAETYAAVDRDAQAWISRLAADRQVRRR